MKSDPVLHARERKRNRERAKRYPDKWREMVARRRAAKLRATPPWLTGEQIKEMVKIYKEAAMIEARTGVQHYVDHIVPLQGKNVSGLHVPWNLQILTADENWSKGRRLDF